MTDEWFTVSSNGSSFTCASGIYYFDITSINTSHDGAFHKVWMYPYGEQLLPLNEQVAFEYNFIMNVHDYDNSYGMLSAGVLWKHRPGNNSTYTWKNAEYFIGVQLVFKKLSGDYLFGLVIRSEHNEREEIWTNDGYPGAMDIGVDLYCTLTGDGNGNYTAEVWRNNWGSGWKVCDLSINTDISFWADRVGVGSGGSGGYYGTTVCNIQGSISDITFESEFQNEIGIINETALRFDGGYLQVAKENNPQCNVLNDAFGFGERRYCIDFYIRFNSLPEPV